MQNPIPGIQSFIFGAGSNAPTYESLQRRRKIADLLAAQATGNTPRNVGEGINAVGKALAGAYMNRKLGPQEDEERQRIAGLLSGGFTGAGTGGYSGDPATVNSGGGGANYRDAIASVESAGSGDYSAVGPVTKSGDRAYGRYQVMGKNIPDWSQEALGKPLTPEEFQANPQAQDKVFDHRFGGYVDQYGPQGAASMWFSGDPTPDGSSDGHMKDTDYVARVTEALGMSPGSFSAQPVDQGRLSQLSEVIGNPYASEGQKVVAQALIEQMIQGSDPSRALGMLGTASQIYEGSQPEEMTPYQAETLKLERERMAQGADPTAMQREYAQAVEQGYKGTILDYQSASAGGSADEASISRLTDAGLDRNTAIGIVDGRLAISRDPVTGAAQVVDKATGKVIGAEAPAPQADPAAPSGPSTSVMPDVDYKGGTGTEGFVSSLANTVSELAGSGLVAPKNERAMQALQNLHVRTQTALAGAVAGRPSNYLLEQFDRMAVRPGSPFQGPGRARERLAQTRDMLDEAIRENVDVARSGVTPQMQAEANANIQRLRRLRDDYNAVIESFGEREGGNATSSGVRWRVVK